MRNLMLTASEKEQKKTSNRQEALGSLIYEHSFH